MSSGKNPVKTPLPRAASLGHYIDVMQYRLFEPTNTDGSHRHYLAPKGHSMIGLITPVTSNRDDAWITSDLAAAEALLPKLNLGPYSKWQIEEVAA